MVSGAAEVKRQFETIAASMVDLPVYNPELGVDAVGFLQCPEGEMGVLITPWCMNLVLLPMEQHEPLEGERLVGSKKMIVLPSGQYEFIAGWFETLGLFYSCSLFSPMFEFSAQDVAVETAQQVMSALFETEHFAPTDRQVAIHTQKEQQAAAQVKAEAKEKLKTSDKPARLSRRGFLTGNLSRPNSEVIRK